MLLLVEVSAFCFDSVLCIVHGFDGLLLPRQSGECCLLIVRFCICLTLLARGFDQWLTELIQFLIVLCVLCASSRAASLSIDNVKWPKSS